MKDLKLTQLEREVFDELSIGNEPEERENQFSHESITVCPEAAAVYDLVKGAELEKEYELMNIGIDIFKKNWPKEYMVLLD